jgi:hypothetical protein
VKRSLGVLFLVFATFNPLVSPASANDAVLNTAIDQLDGYKRTLFKHWIDSDKDGCDTRAEVLIEEAIVKPKIGPKCKLTGGKWFSTYDGKNLTNASLLDVDHLVPLAEAWRSGAWKWTDAQRQTFANDLENSEALVAVSLSTNRSKGDKDPALWMPLKEQCTYTKNWINVKVKYSLTVDSNEAIKLNSLIVSCGFGATITPQPNPTVSISPNPAPSDCVNSVLKIVTASVEDKAKLFEFENSLVGYSKLSTKYTSSIDKALLLIAETKSLKVVVCRGKFDSLPLLGATLAVENQVKSMITSVTSLIGNIQKEIDTSPTPLPIPSSTETPPSQDLIVTPGAFCSPAGATGKSKSGVSYTCKSSPTDTRNRWRP